MKQFHIFSQNKHIFGVRSKKFITRSIKFLILSLKTSLYNYMNEEITHFVGKIICYTLVKNSVAFGSFFLILQNSTLFIFSHFLIYFLRLKQTFIFSFLEIISFVIVFFLFLMFSKIFIPLAKLFVKLFLFFFDNIQHTNLYKLLCM